MPKGSQNLGRRTNMKKCEFNTLKERLSDKEIDYQKISDITYAVANEKDQNGNQTGNGRNAGNRFEAALRYSLVNACHDVSDPDDKSKSDIRFNCINGHSDLQVKRYQPGFAQISTMAGNNYFTDLKEIYNNSKDQKVTGSAMKSYFEKYELPPDLLMVQNNQTGKTDYYLFEVEELAKKAKSLEYISRKNCDAIRLKDKDDNTILEVRSGEEPQANCLTRGAWVNTDWLENNKDTKPIVSNVADKSMDVNKLLFGY